MRLRLVIPSAVLVALVAAGQALSFGPIGTDLRMSSMGADGDTGRYAAEPAIAYDVERNRYLVTWDGNDLTAVGDSEIFGQLVGATGAETGPDDFRISNTGPDGDETHDVFASAAAFNAAADEYLVVWDTDGLSTDDETEVFGQRVSAAGAQEGVDFRISNAGTDTDATRDASEAAVAYNSATNQYLVVWQGDPGTDDEDEISGQLVSAAGTEVGSDFPISSAGPNGDASRDAGSGRVVYNPTANEYLVVWAADGLATNDEFEVFGRRVSAAGVGVGTEFRISNVGIDGDAARDAGQPSIAYDRTSDEYLVVWRANALPTAGEFEIFGQRLSAAGAERGTDFRISNVGADGDAGRAPSTPDVAYDSVANEYLVAWSGDGLAVDNEQEIFGQRLSATGASVGSDFRISKTGVDGDPSRDAGFPAIAFNPAADAYLVAWQAEGLGIDGEYEVFSHLIDADPPAPPAPPAPPGGGPKPPVAVPADTSVALAVGAKRRQRALRRKALQLRASCGAEACGVVARASVRVRRAKGSRTFSLRRTTRRLAAGERARMEIKLPRKVRRAARRALLHGRRVTATISVKATDAAGNVATRRSRVTIVR